MRVLCLRLQSVGTCDPHCYRPTTDLSSDRGFEKSLSVRRAEPGLIVWKEDFAPVKAVPQRDLLTAAELRSALEELRPVDLVRLQKKATALAPGTGMEPDDLMQESLTSALEENGGRNCPRDVNPVNFLGNAIRSIASHARVEWAREMPTGAREQETKTTPSWTRPTWRRRRKRPS